MRLLIATDAAPPQINGVVRTQQRLAVELRRLGHTVLFVTPDQFATVPCPGYREIRLAIPNMRRAHRLLDAAEADFIHVATEGPVGFMARGYCLSQRRPFTTSYHTKFPEYASALLKIPARWCHAPLRRFHNASAGTMVATPSLARELEKQGFERLNPWTRGVDTELFRTRDVRLFGNDAPVFLYVGRISKEKNIEAFLDAKLEGRKVVVGGGPLLFALRRHYPEVLFTGPKSGEELAEHYASADVFVFPSRTDTFGLVQLEAMASGVPVAAFPVTGPIDVVADGVSGVLSDNLGEAACRALKLDRKAALAHARTFSWARAANMFLENVERARALQQVQYLAPGRRSTGAYTCTHGGSID